LTTSFQYLDVSEYPAPEPMQLTLEAIQNLIPGQFLHLHHRRYPKLLFERLDQRGFAYDIRRDANDCEVFIWRKDDADAADRAVEIASSFPVWSQ